MVRLVMFFQTAWVKITLSALFEDAFVLAAVVLLVGLEMLFEVAAAGEGFFAVFTFEGLFAGVHALMTDEIRLLGEGLVAIRAGERLCFVVDAAVFLKRRELSEFLFTDFTDESFAIVVGSLVFFD